MSVDPRTIGQVGFYNRLVLFKTTKSWTLSSFSEVFLSDLKAKNDIRSIRLDDIFSMMYRSYCMLLDQFTPIGLNIILSHCSMWVIPCFSGTGNHCSSIAVIFCCKVFLFCQLISEEHRIMSIKTSEPNKLESRSKVRAMAVHQSQWNGAKKSKNKHILKCFKYCTPRCKANPLFAVNYTVNDK